MTELQLRLWCLWMCGAYADMEWEEHIDAATEGATDVMRELIFVIDKAFHPRHAWELSERMP